MKKPSSRIVCPKCRQAGMVIPIIYSCSRADYERYRALEKAGEVILAGCIISVDTPKFFCKRCRLNIWNEDIDRASETN